jgi:hypothetical protein
MFFIVTRLPLGYFPKAGVDFDGLQPFQMRRELSCHRRPRGCDA